MITVVTLGWLSVAVGVLISFTLGWRSPYGFWGTVGLLAIDIGVGIGLTVLLFAGSALCIEALKLCQPTNDHTIWSIAFPMIFIPICWGATLLAKLAS